MYFTQKWSTIFGMENILVLSIFIHKLGDGLIPKAKDLFWEIAVIVVTVVYQGRNGRLSIAALESNLWQAFAPWITTLCLLAGWHVYRAYQATRGEINRVEYQGTKKQRSQIIITDADGHTEPTKHPNYQLRLKGVVACCFAILSLCIAMSWRFAIVTSEPNETFNISDDSMPSFINMSQDLSSVNSGWFWLVYNINLASPIALTQYVEITNLQATPETIQHFSVAMYAGDCGWTYLTPMDIRDATVLWTYLGLANGQVFDFKSNGLNYLFERAIPPYQTVGGWWFFDSKVKCDVPDGTRIQFRISLSTYSGLHYEHTTPVTLMTRKNADLGNTTGSTKTPKFVVPPGKPTMDISRFYERQLYSSVSSLRIGSN